MGYSRSMGFSGRYSVFRVHLVGLVIVAVVAAAVVNCTLLAAESGVAERRQTKPAEGDSAAKPAQQSAASKQADKQPQKKAAIGRIVLSGQYPEGSGIEGLFGELQPSLPSVLERLQQAAEDKALSGVWLRLEELDIGPGKINELRAAIGRVRRAGKSVYAELATAETPQYLVASACDEIIMPPSGVLLLPGVRAEITFYKGLLDKLGIQVDLYQMGKYKGAAEPFTRNNLSQPLRESLEAIVDDIYNDLAKTIAADRKLPDYQVKTLMDQGLFTAAAAQRARLIDHVAYSDQFHETVRRRLKVDQVEIIPGYKKKQVETDFSGLTGLIKLMELIVGGKPAEKVTGRKKVAVVYAVGPIVEGESLTDIFGQSAVGSSTLMAALRKAADDPKVVAIVLRVDSPGGSAVASDLIWRETVRINKPVIASMGDVAASGGYYIAMGARKIFAEPGTVTGSIGVVGGKLVLKGLYQKIGVDTEVISRGAISGMFSATEPFSEAERKALNGLLQETYRQFVSKAAQGRKMSTQELEKHAQGRVFTGRMAKAVGLVDELGTLQDAIAEAKQAAGLKPDEPVDIMVLPRPVSIFEQLFGGGSSGELEAAAPELARLLRQAKLYRRLLCEPAMLWMPYSVKFK